MTLFISAFQTNFAILQCPLQKIAIFARSIELKENDTITSY